MMATTSTSTCRRYLGFFICWWFFIHSNDDCRKMLKYLSFRHAMSVQTANDVLISRLANSKRDTCYFKISLVTFALAFMKKEKIKKIKWMKNDEFASTASLQHHNCNCDEVETKKYWDKKCWECWICQDMQNV